VRPGTCRVPAMPAPCPLLKSRISGAMCFTIADLPIKSLKKTTLARDSVGVPVPKCVSLGASVLCGVLECRGTPAQTQTQDT
jgi:hypothetical protein